MEWGGGGGYCGGRSEELTSAAVGGKRAKETF